MCLPFHHSCLPPRSLSVSPLPPWSIPRVPHPQVPFPGSAVQSVLLLGVGVSLRRDSRTQTYLNRLKGDRSDHLSYIPVEERWLSPPPPHPCRLRRMVDHTGTDGSLFPPFLSLLLFTPSLSLPPLTQFTCFHEDDHVSFPLLEPKSSSHSPLSWVGPSWSPLRQMAWPSSSHGPPPSTLSFPHPVLHG